MSAMQWLTTAPNPDRRRAKRSMSNADDGQRGWKMHAVRADESTKFSEIRSEPSACGLLPSHGWGLDMFIEEQCSRCVAVLARPIKFNWREKVWPAEARRCDDCGKRRKTFQAKDDAYGNETRCTRCMRERLLSSNDGPTDKATHG